MQTVNIFGIEFSGLTFDEALDDLHMRLCRMENHIVVTPNPEAVMQSRRNIEFKEALQAADSAFADGVGIIIGARILGARLPERVRGLDITYALFDRLNTCGKPFSAYFLGGTPGVAEAAAQNMQRKYPWLQIAGFHDGYFVPGEDSHILDEINSQRPDILLVCMGMPRAEIWAHKNRHLLTGLTLCVGGTIDVMAGRVRLAPGLIRGVGLEWLYRLICQPSRIRRMLDLPRFVALVLGTRLLKGGNE